MTLPVGYRFRPTDLELVVDYLEKKYSEDEALPCDIVIHREIYGDKAPWQNFTDEDPWEISKTKDKKKDVWKTEGTIYVFTTLTNASQNRIARKAGCGSWHGETAREEVKNDKDCAIGYKTTLYFEIAADEPIAMHGPVEKGHWIMQEYSLRDGDTDKSKGKYVLCRIKRFDSKYTKVSPRKRKNAEAATTDNDLVVSKRAKRVRTEVMQEKKMECDITAAPDTEVVPFSKDQLFVQDQSFLMSDDPNELTVEELEAIWEVEEEQGSYLPRHCDNSALVPLDRNTVSSNTKFHKPAAYDLDESFPVVEQQQGFGLDCNAFGNISSTPEDDWVQYSNPSHTRAENLSNLSNIEAWLSAEPLPSDQESDRMLVKPTESSGINQSPINHRSRSEADQKQGQLNHEFTEMISHLLIGCSTQNMFRTILTNSKLAARSWFKPPPTHMRDEVLTVRVSQKYSITHGLGHGEPLRHNDHGEEGFGIYMNSYF
ncbi:hypothetical protein RHMOL_Rhmol02G0254600 [Rhododendron molle]|uniref:Uncharacterized protein n=1 Tax=Rhododendron molle TaxID=49168 RepID=A0ACC0PWT5_RHOML|nr:hypothetical protein RHMOL_Rhmol02G0254600 [Rhododendron molle]